MTQPRLDDLFVFICLSTLGIVAVGVSSFFVVGTLDGILQQLKRLPDLEEAAIKEEKERRQ